MAGHSNISWIHDIQTEKYNAASDTLQALAENEVKFVAKKKAIFIFVDLKFNNALFFIESHNLKSVFLFKNVQYYILSYIKHKFVMA